MGTSGWYVAQVRTGSEREACRRIAKACKGSEADGRPLLEECFSPAVEARLKYAGEWRRVERPLLPGYVVAVTRDPVGLYQRLRGVRHFRRLLDVAGVFVPLNEEERRWLEDSTSRDRRVVPISLGHREGERIVVTKGPLGGREATIRKVIRKKCLAEIEVHAGGKTIRATVGLALLPKDEDSHGA